MLEPLTAHLVSILVVSLRFIPTLAFAPPFTLVDAPGTVRLLLALSLAACVSGSLPADMLAAVSAGPGLAQAALAELTAGIVLALCFQIAFAMIGVAARALDIQAGFGLAFLIDPTTRAQTPLIGAVFTYAAAAVFFATSGPADTLGALAASFKALPPGTMLANPPVGALIGYIGTVSVLALGVVGLLMLVLFMLDLVIAMLSRTLPQMNVLVLGFQVKALATLLLLPATLGIGGAAIARILRIAAETAAGIL